MHTWALGVATPGVRSRPLIDTLGRSRSTHPQIPRSAARILQSVKIMEGEAGTQPPHRFERHGRMQDGKRMDCNLGDVVSKVRPRDEVKPPSRPFIIIIFGDSAPL
jgi:hypothetical protein